MTRALEDRIALITGGGSGIGRAIARRFAEEGARVLVNDIRGEAARETVAWLGGAPHRALEADVADSARVRAMFADVEQSVGTVDILVNNAGFETSAHDDEITIKSAIRLQELLSGKGIQTHWDLTQKMSDDEWQRMIGVHLDGTFYCTREALRLMNRSGRGVIINMSSVGGQMGLAHASHYSAAKAAVIGFTRAVAQEVASRGIRVNVVCPGLIETPMTQHLGPVARTVLLSRIPLGRSADPQEVAAAVLFLASDESAYITGQELAPNGGLFVG